MFERFTTSARLVVQQARAEAADLGHRTAGTEHLLLALLHPDAGRTAALLREAGVTAHAIRARLIELDYARPATDTYAEDAQALRGIGIDLDAVRSRIDDTFGPGTFDSVDADADPAPTRSRWGRRRPGVFSPRGKKVLELSLREALRLKHRYIGTEHILLGLIREGEGLGVKLLVDAGVDPAALRDRVVAVVPPKAA
ncbi:Clp protease N-terminal domain-containing protein [Luedemannella helvata]|uniref:Clp protease N-terminal domain-containing protein n=1 Tax=Luedemannella helvata TaxID=349315 RepID=A0ABN2K3E5_9ACTN